MEMTWQLKAEAFAALTELRIKFRPIETRFYGAEPWYVEQDIDIRDVRTLIGAYGNGISPIDAINDHWSCLVTNLKAPLCLLVRSRDESKPKRYVRWNGFMWADVEPPKEKTP